MKIIPVIITMNIIVENTSLIASFFVPLRHQSVGFAKIMIPIIATDRTKVRRNATAESVPSILPKSSSPLEIIEAASAIYAVASMAWTRPYFIIFEFVMMFLLYALFV